MSNRFPTYDEILRDLPKGKSRKVRSPRARKHKQIFKTGATVVSRFRTMNRQGQNVSTGAKGFVLGFNASSGKYFVQWSNGDGYYHEDVLDLE